MSMLARAITKVIGRCQLGLPGCKEKLAANEGVVVEIGVLTSERYGPAEARENFSPVYLEATRPKRKGVVCRNCYDQIFKRLPTVDEFEKQLEATAEPASVQGESA